VAAKPEKGRGRRGVGKKTPSKRQRTPLETLDEGIPPPKDFEDSQSAKQRLSAHIESDSEEEQDTSSAG
jgi:hypothetical protein